MANRITVILDALGFDRAAGQVKGFSQSVKEADGVGGKLKAGWKSATDSIKQNAGALALGAGTAIAAFGVKAVQAFVDAATAARELAAATGLSVEDASRWIAVADDMNISAEDLVGRLGRLSREFTSGKAEEYGIAVRDASGQTRDMNDVLIDTLVMLGNVTNETERARIGNDLFGRGYKDLAPLVGKTREEYEDWLGSVEAGQVITAEESAKAERMRLAQDALADAVNEATLAFGSLVAEAAPTIEFLAGAVTKTTEFADQLERVDGLKEALTLALDPNPVNKYNAVIGLAADSIDTATTSVEDFRAALEEKGFTQEQINDLVEEYYTQQSEANEATEDAAGATRDAAEATQKFKDLVNEAREAVEKQTKAIEAQQEATRSAIDADFALRSATRDATTAISDYTAKAASAETTTEDLVLAQENAEKAALDQADAAVRLAEQQAKANGQTLTNKQTADIYRESLLGIAATLDPNSSLARNLVAYADRLGSIPSNAHTDVTVDTSLAEQAIAAFKAAVSGGQVTIPVRAQVSAGGGGASGGRKQRASGGPTWRGEAFEINERGHPEVLQEGGRTYLLPGGDGQVTPLAPMAQGGGGGSSNRRQEQLLEQILHALTGGSMTLLVEGEPITARIMKREREIAGALRAGRRS